MVRWLISWTCFCQALLDLPVALRYAASGFDQAPNAKKKLYRHYEQTFENSKAAKIYGIYTPEIWICYCDVTILYSGHFWTFPNICLAAIIQAKFHVSTTHVKRETVGAFCTWKLERLQVHHGIGKLEPPAIQCSLAVNVSFEFFWTLWQANLSALCSRSVFLLGARVGSWLSPLNSYNRTSPGACRAPARACERGQVGWGCLVWIPLVHGPIVIDLRVCTCFLFFSSQPARDFLSYWQQRFQNHPKSKDMQRWDPNWVATIW